MNNPTSASAGKSNINIIPSSMSNQTAADPKVLFLLKKYQQTKQHPNLILSDCVTHLITSQREYRKLVTDNPDYLDTLRGLVNTALEVLNENNNVGVGKKRKLEQKLDERHEAEAQEIEKTIKRSNSGSMLNAGLRSGYQQRKLADEVSKAAAVSSRSSSPAGINQSEGEASVPQTPTNTSAKKRTNKHKKISSKNESNSHNGNANSGSNSLGLIVERPKTRYSDLGGIDGTLQVIRELIEYPLSHPEVFSHLGVEPPRGVLLRGPPGTGKTLLAHAVAGQLGVAFIKVSAPEIVSGMSGESEQKLRELFTAASNAAPAILFIDEIDAIAPKRDGGGNSRGMEKRIVAQMLTCLDGLAPENNANGRPVMVLGATNRPDSLDPALRRAGRFDREIIMGVPDEAGRARILHVMTKSMRLEGEFDFKLIAKKTPGYVGADIRSLTKEAAIIAINRIFKELLDDTEKDTNNSTYSSVMMSSTSPLTPDQLEPLNVSMDDFLEAVKRVQPSSKREGFATVPDVSWKDIGALESIREELSLSVLEPISNPEYFKELGLPLPAGVMLYGPPGCGKTLLAKAIANESGANFISVKGPELLDKYVGESERAVRQVFERARASSPCIVFFDELDSLCPRRGSDSGGGGVSERVVNQLLTEMDGLESRSSVFVIAATNRPELIDPAMMRPGRLDKLLYVPLPGPNDRASILSALALKVNITDDVDLSAIARSPRAEGFSGADCAALLREAGLAVLRDHSALKKKCIEVKHPLQINKAHFDYAFDHVMPSVSAKDQKKYDKIRDRMARARTRDGVNDAQTEKNNTDEANKSLPIRTCDAVHS